ncbi:MAG TPA: S8 family serine peptidase [Actinomycetota bacterium]|nr:S8 family serine peptidase [Actinomycetota bacterium]
MLRRALVAVVSLLLLVGTVPPVSSAASPRLDLAHDPSHILVSVRSGSDPLQLPGLLGTSVASVLAPQNAAVVSLPQGTSVSAAIAAFSRLPQVESAEPNFALATHATPNDPFYPGNARVSVDLWGLHNTGQSGGAADADVDAPEGWDLAGVAGSGAWGNSGYTVGIVDTGIDAAHEDLNGKSVTPCYSALSGAGTLAGGCADDDGHGTHVAGTIGAWANNGRGIAGVAPNAKVYPCKALGPAGGWTSDVAACVNHLASKRDSHNLRVINLSLGGPASRVLETAVNSASANGVLVVAAAGNDGNSTLNYPAAYSSVLSVAAMDRSGRRASFSNYNSDVELAAPGASVVSTVPGGYGSWSGTSMAAPHVAGIAALASWKTGRTAQGLRDLLTSSAEDLGTPGRDTSFGYGRTNVCRALGGCGAPPPPPLTTNPSPAPAPTSAPAPAPAPTGNGTLNGTAWYGAALLVVQGVVVTFQGGGVIGSVRTNSNGDYSASLPAAGYTVSAKMGSASCRAGSPVGPTSTTANVSPGAVTRVGWYCS